MRFVHHIGRHIHRGQRGAVLPLAVGGVILAIVASALSIDLGRLAQERRRNQKVADLAALDAVRDLSVGQIRAEASAGRNGFEFTTSGNPQATRGFLVAGIFTADSAGDTVRVIARSNLENAFLTGERDVSATAYARMKKEAGFSIGSSLATLNFDAANVLVLNRVIARLIGASSVDLDVVSYNGLAAANVTLGRLATQLGFGTVNELLTADLTMGQILTAAAAVLTSDGVVGAAELNQIATAASATTLISVGDFVTVAQGSEDAAARTSLHVLQLIGATGSVANKDNLLSIDDAFLATPPIPGVGSVGTSLGLKVIEGPKTYIGPENGFVETSQVELTLTTNVNADVDLGGLIPLLKVSGAIPVTTVGAGARGTLTRVTCAGANQGIGVRVDPRAVSASVLAPTLVLKGPLGIPTATVTGVGFTPGTTGASSTLGFAYFAEFSPSATSKSTPSSAPGLNGLTSLQSGSVQFLLPLLPPVNVPVATVADAIFNAVDPLMNQVEARLLMPALKALGLSIGSADVAALRDSFDPTKCGLPVLVR